MTVIPLRMVGALAAAGLSACGTAPQVPRADPEPVAPSKPLAQMAVVDLFQGASLEGVDEAGRPFSAHYSPRGSKLVYRGGQLHGGRWWIDAAGQFCETPLPDVPSPEAPPRDPAPRDPAPLCAPVVVAAAEGRYQVYGPDGAFYYAFTLEPPRGP
ncbi:MAG: hypothetical protein ACFCBW_16180 [Candidatus Competibacterales bacterium]